MLECVSVGVLECLNALVGLARLETEFPEVTEFSEVTGRWCEKWSEDRNLMISGFLFVGGELWVVAG